MKELIDVGNKYGRLTIVKEVERILCGGNLVRVVEAKCDCGIIGNYKINHLRSGNTKSCGCWNTEVRKNSLTTHGMKYTRIYKCWENMKSRCSNPNKKDFKHYGGRGIKVCKRWEKFENFYEDMKDSHLEELTLDRINVNGDYCKSNCRWITHREQMRNCRNSIVIEFNGCKETLVDWSVYLGISYSTLYYRFKKGWSAKKILTTPPLC